MQHKNIEPLWYFVLRAGMYTGKEKKERIAAFLHGYVLADEHCFFLPMLREAVSTNYQITGGSTGWVGQIALLAKKQKCSWYAAFRQESIRLLMAFLDDTNDKELKNKLLDTLKKRIIGHLEGIKVQSPKRWIKRWQGLCDFSAPWFLTLWSVQELAMLRQIETKMHRIVSSGTFKLSPKIKQLAAAVTGS